MLYILLENSECYHLQSRNSLCHYLWGLFKKRGIIFRGSFSTVVTLLSALTVFLNDCRNILFKKNFSIRNTDVTLDDTKWIRWPSKYWYYFCPRIALPVKLMGDELLTRWDFQLLYQRLCLLLKTLSLTCFKTWRWKNWLNFRLLFLEWYFCQHQTLFDFITGDFSPVRFTAIDIVLSKRLNSSYNLAEGTEDVYFPSSWQRNKTISQKITYFNHNYKLDISLVLT
jgi:hypothetical protein